MMMMFYTTYLRTLSVGIFVSADWKKVFQEEFDLNDLPVHWGGNAMGPDNDPYCKRKVQYTGCKVMKLQ